jgi:hypothetical protein
MTQSNNNPKKPQKVQMITFRLSNQAVLVIRELTKRLSLDARINISMGKVVELAIFHAEHKSLEELLND